MMDVIVRGGIMMVPILLGSVLALTIVIERLWTLQRSRIIPADFLRRMQGMVAEGRTAEALSACRENDSSLARVLASGLQAAGLERSRIQEELQSAGRREASLLLRWVGALGAIAALEPMMGLLGTVLGLIQAFREVEKLKVVGNPSVVAAGVWQALITTAAGLMIAIPAYAMYRYFRSRVMGLVLSMEGGANDLLRSLERAGSGGKEGRP